MTSTEDFFSTTFSANLGILAGWVTDASGGRFALDIEATERDRHTHGWVVLNRADGETLPSTHGPMSAVLVSIFVPSARRLDRRNRTTMREVVKGVHFAAKTLATCDDEKVSTWMATRRFETRNRLV